MTDASGLDGGHDQEEPRPAPTAAQPVQTEPDQSQPVESETVSVLLAVPELAPGFLRLAEAADGDPGAAAVFGELADYVSDLLAEIDHHRATLERCAAVVEQVARTSADAEELVAWTFLDALTPAERSALRPWLGPRTTALEALVDGPGP